MWVSVSSRRKRYLFDSNIEHSFIKKEPELVEVVKHAWKNAPQRKILTSFEWRRDVSQKATETEGWCPHEGKGGKGHKRVYEGEDNAELRFVYVVIKDLGVFK